MWSYWQVMLLDAAIIGISYIIFRYSLSGEWRHKVWEKYIDSFSLFIIIVFAVTILINIIAYAILYYFRLRQYIYVVAPSVISVFVGFIIASVPWRGVESRK